MTENFENMDEQQKVQMILEVCEQGTHNSVTKDDLLCLLRYMAFRCIQFEAVRNNVETE